MSPFRWDVLLVGFVLAVPVLALGLRGDLSTEEMVTRLPWCLGRGLGRGRAAAVREHPARPGEAGPRGRSRAVSARTASTRRRRADRRVRRCLGVFLALPGSAGPRSRENTRIAVVHRPCGCPRIAARGSARRRTAHRAGMTDAAEPVPASSCAATPSPRAGPTTNSAASSAPASSPGCAAAPTSTRSSRRTGRPCTASWSRPRIAGLRRPAVVSHQSAAVLHGLPLWDVPLDRVHVTRRPRGVERHRARSCACHVARLRDDEVTLVDGIAVTDPVRTALDLARSLPARGGRRRPRRGAARAAPCRTTCCADATVRHRGHAREPERRARGRAADGRSESVGESRSRVHPAPLGAAAVGAPVRDPVRGRRLVGRTDFAWEEQRLVGRVRRADQVRPAAAPGPGRRATPCSRRSAARTPSATRTGTSSAGSGPTCTARIGWPRASAGHGSARRTPMTRSRGCCSRSPGSCRTPTSANNTPGAGVRAGGPPASR